MKLSAGTNGVGETTEEDPMMRPIAQIIKAKSTLVDLAREALELTQTIIESGGEITSEIEERVEANELRIADKVDAYSFIEERLDAEAQYWDRKAKAFANIARGFKGARERLLARIKFFMGEMQLKEVQGHDYRFVLAGSMPRLVVNEALLPAEYKMQVTQVIPDKERIREALLLGANIPGAYLEETGALRKYENPDRGK
jgi:hypothetical protein